MSPRQLAVALKYLKGQEGAPRVIAKGRGFVADRILELARRHGIPVHRDTDLAQVLVRLDLGDFVPPELYKAVAQVLAYLYKMNGRYP
jgi:flagellar biosynthesis protein